MKIIEKFKNQPKIIQILDIIFLICLIYEIILLILTGSMDYTISALMIIILGVTSWYNLFKS